MNIEILFSKYEKYPDFLGIRIVDVNQRSVIDDTMLHIASRNAAIEDVLLLLEHGANINIQGDLGYIALHYACMKGYLDVVKLLLKYNASKTIKNEFDELPIDVNNNDIAHYMFVSLHPKDVLEICQ